MNGLIDQINNKIDYVELAVTDISRAKRFFGDAFGWTFVDYGENYCEFCDGRIKGGFERADIVTSGGALIVLYHENLDAARHQVLAAGGQVTKPIFSFPGGERFQFKDPEGHEWAVWRKSA